METLQPNYPNLDIDLSGYRLDVFDSSIENQDNFRRWDGVKYVSHNETELTVRVSYIEMIYGHKASDFYVEIVPMSEVPQALKEKLFAM